MNRQSAEPMASPNSVRRWVPNKLSTVHILESGIFEVDEDIITQITLEGRRKRICDIPSSDLYLFDVPGGLLLLDTTINSVAIHKSKCKSLKWSPISRKSGRPLTLGDKNVTSAIWSQSLGYVLTINASRAKLPVDADLISIRKICPTGSLSNIAQVPRCRFNTLNPTHILDHRGQVYLSYSQENKDGFASSAALVRIYDLTRHDVRRQLPTIRTRVAEEMLVRDDGCLICSHDDMISITDPHSPLARSVADAYSGSELATSRIIIANLNRIICRENELVAITRDITSTMSALFIDMRTMETARSVPIQATRNCNTIGYHQKHLVVATSDAIIMFD